MKTKHIRVCIGIFSVVILVFLIFLLVKNGPLNTVPTSKLRFENGNTVTLDYAISTEAGCFYSVSVPDTINSAYAASQNRSSNSPGTLSHHPDHLIRKFRANPSSTTYLSRITYLKLSSNIYPFFSAISAKTFAVGILCPRILLSPTTITYRPFCFNSSRTAIIFFAISSK